MRYTRMNSWADAEAYADKFIDTLSDADKLKKNLDLSDFLVISGRSFEEGSTALNTVCDRVCGKFGQLLVTFAGSLRIVLEEGFGSAVNGGVASFFALEKGCQRYGKAKSALKSATGNKVAAARAEVGLAQGDIIRALGGTIITASVQREFKGKEDLLDFLAVSGGRFEQGSAVLVQTCDKVCSSLGRLIASVIGGVRVVKDGFKSFVRGGVLTFDELDGACKQYAQAKRLPAGREREVAVGKAQAEIIRVLGGAIILGEHATKTTTQKSPVPFPDGNQFRYLPEQRGAPSTKSSVVPLLLVVGAGGILATTLS